MEENTIITGSTNPQAETATPPKLRFSKRIGSTTYRVLVSFSDASKETMNDKIIRMIKNEATGKVVRL